MASKNSELWHQARRVRDTLVERLVDHPEVSLVDIGYDPEPEPGQDPDRVVVQVHVRRASEETILDLPQEVEGVLVRVVPGDYQPQQPAAPPATTQDPPSQDQASNRAGRRGKRAASAAAKRGSPPQASAQPSDADWQGLGDFTTSFGLASGDSEKPRLETRARHVQTGAAMRWQGAALAELGAWMTRLANLPLAGSDPAQAADQERALEPQPGEAAVVELSGLWVSTAKVPGLPGVRGGPDVLRAEVCFSIVEPTPALLSARQLPYTIELSLLNCETDESSLVALYEGSTRPGEMDCPVEQDFPIPPPGRYRLNLFARLLTPGNGSDRLEGPIIVVEE